MCLEITITVTILEKGHHAILCAWTHLAFIITTLCRRYYYYLLLPMRKCGPDSLGNLP